MSIGSQAVATGTLLDYLQDDIMRPDIYEERSFVTKDIHGPGDRKQKESSKWSGLLYTVGIIILSAAIFLTAVAWVDVIRSWLDSKYVNEVISAQTKSRLYYALIITSLAIMIILFLLFLWYYEVLMPHQRTQVHHVILKN